MTNVHVFIVIILLFCMGYGANSQSNNGYVKKACSVARYRDICITTLAPYSNSAKGSPRKWAQAAVTVTMNEAKNVGSYLNTLGKTGHFRRRQKGALSGCLECFQETLGKLYDSLGELARLDASTFGTQMGNVETWMSAALTYEDTCLDGFRGTRKGKQVKILRRKVRKVSYVTSNALALVNKLAQVGGRSLTKSTTP